MTARARIAPAVAAVLLLSTGSARAQDDDASSIDDRPHITVLGSATADVAPDTAEVRLGVALDRPTAGEAWNATRVVAAALVDAAKADGVAAFDIATTSVDLAQKFDSVRLPDGSSRNEAHGFHAAYMLRVRLHDFSRIGTLTQTLIGKGANTFEGVSFTTAAKNDAVQDKLWGDAMRDAHRKAQALADAAGVKLGPLLQAERPDQPNAQRPLMRSAVAAPSMPFAAGAQTLSAEIEATYAID